MKSKGIIQIILGLLLIAAALFLTGYNLYLTRSAGQASSSALSEIMDTMQQEQTPPVHTQSAHNAAEPVIYPDYVLNPEMPMPVEEIDGRNYVAILRIPGLNIELPIFSDYVYDYLRIAPCRYYGSVYNNSMVICAHNYDSHFGRLKDMSIGDRLTLEDMDGNLFTYEVAEIIVLNPSDMDEFIDSGYALTLFTCTYGGASRVTVRCDLLETAD